MGGADLSATPLKNACSCTLRHDLTASVVNLLLATSRVAVGPLQCPASVIVNAPQGSSHAVLAAVLRVAVSIVRVNSAAGRPQCHLARALLQIAAQPRMPAAGVHQAAAPSSSAQQGSSKGGG